MGWSADLPEIKRKLFRYLYTAVSVETRLCANKLPERIINVLLDFQTVHGGSMEVRGGLHGVPDNVCMYV